MPPKTQKPVNVAAPAATPAPPSYYERSNNYSGGAAINDQAYMAAAANNTIMTSPTGVKGVAATAKQNLKSLMGQ